MQVKQRRVALGFDRISSFYDVCVRLVFGNDLNDFTHHALSQFKPANHLLIFGGGTGQVLKSALQLKLAKHHSYCEVSPKMIAATKNRLSEEEATQVQFIEHLDEGINIDTIDIAVFPFVLDCFKENSILELFDQLNPHLTSLSQILIIDFNRENIDGFKPSLIQKIWIKVLYVFFKNFTGIEAAELPLIFKIMRQKGFVLNKNISIQKGWIQGSYWMMK